LARLIQRRLIFIGLHIIIGKECSARVSSRLWGGNVGPTLRTAAKESTTCGFGGVSPCTVVVIRSMANHSYARFTSWGVGVAP
jgi:hypothetical protein